MKLFSSFEKITRPNGTLEERKTRSEILVAQLKNFCNAHEIFIPRKKIYRHVSVYLERYPDFICVPKRLQMISNSPFLAQRWLKQYKALIQLHPDWFTEKPNFDEFVLNYPSCLINILSKAYIIGRDKIDELMYPAVMVPLTGSPFLPWSEIMLRSSFILDLHMALEKLDSNGGNISSLDN